MSFQFNQNRTMNFVSIIHSDLHHFIIYHPDSDHLPHDDVDDDADINQVGLYDQCVTVRLADGRIVEQNIYPGETHCKYDHDLYITRSLGTCLI